MRLMDNLYVNIQPVNIGLILTDAGKTSSAPVLSERGAYVRILIMKMVRSWP